MATIRNLARDRARDDGVDRFTHFNITVNPHYVPRSVQDMHEKAEFLKRLVDEMLEGGDDAPIFDMIGHRYPEVREVSLVGASVERSRSQPINPATGRRFRGPPGQLHAHLVLHIRHRISRVLPPAKTAFVDIGEGRMRRARLRYGMEPGVFQKRMQEYFTRRWPFTRRAGGRVHVWAKLARSGAEMNYLLKDQRRSTATATMQERARSQGLSDLENGFESLRV